MTRKVYIVSRSEIRPGAPDPDFRQLLSPMEARRMGRLLKRAVWTSRQALSAAGLEVPDAIMTATDFGCVENSESFLKALKGQVDEPLRPTHFMQSTHNTISSLIAIRLGCHGYNATYSHRGESLKSALLDAWMQISLGDIDHALVGFFDEVTPALLASFPDENLQEHCLSLVLSASAEGALCECTLNDLDELCGS